MVLVQAAWAAEDADAPESFAPGIDLPGGEGKAELESACTQCHDLKGLPAYKGYWGRERWQAMVNTMVENGAKLDERGKERVVEYLTVHFGPGSR